MAVSVSDAEGHLLEWLIGQPRLSQDPRDNVLSGVEKLIQGGSFRRITNVVALDLQLNKVYTEIAVLDTPDFGADHPQADLKDQAVPLPFTMKRIAVDSLDPTKPLVVDNVIQYTAEPTTYEITDPTLVDAMQVALDANTQLDLRQQSLSTQQAVDGDYSLANQLVDVSWLSLEQRAAVLAATGVSAEIDAIKVQVLADIAADKVIADNI